MNKLSLAVIFGGQSSEYSVSLHSTASFLRALHTDRYELTTIGITKDGNFFLYEGSIDDLEHDHWCNEKDSTPCAWIHGGIITVEEKPRTFQFDVAFPVLHGKNGEDGCIQGLFELMNIHYVGCDVMSSSISMDKEIMHILCDEANIPCAQYICLRENQENPSFEEIQKTIPLPWIIKPCNAGSSYGVHFVENEEEFNEAVKDAFFYDGRGKILVEKVIKGFEIGCAVMGDSEIKTGSCDEIEIKGGFFDFEGKYEMKDAAIHCPARIDQATFDEAQELARRVYKAMNCTGLARVDMFVQNEGGVVLNELNTIPGLTATSRYPSMMKAVGLEFSDLIDQLISLAMERKVGVC